MPFAASFDCLWCGRAHRTRGADDLEGFARLCPECVGRAGENGFLRFRLKAALEERSARGQAAPAVAIAERPSDPAPARAGGPALVDDGAEMRAYYAARAREYDDWYLRRGRYSRGPVRDFAWHAELDEATRWLDGVPIGGEIRELAAGTGWWSPLLAQKGDLTLTDAVPETLDRARDRLVAHGLRAHVHVADAWAEPDLQVDALFTGFWLSHVPRARLDEFLRLARRWLRDGGTYAFIDSRPDPDSGARDHPDPDFGTGTAIRTTADGREFRIPKVYYEPGELRDALLRAGFSDSAVDTTARFFLLGRATA